MKLAVIGVTFDPRDAECVSRILGDAGISGGAEGTMAGGYWITTTRAEAQKALWQIQSNFRFREMDLNVSLIEPGDISKEWTEDRLAELIQGLAGECYQQASRDSLERWFDALPE